jgi:hypothetical protein
MLVRKGLRKGKYMSGGCQLFIQVQPYRLAGKVLPGSGREETRCWRSIGPLLCDRGATGTTAGAVYISKV